MADVVHALRTGIAKRGWFEYAVVDHGSDMKTVGASPHEAFTIVFGNPALGSRILAKAWTMGRGYSLTPRRLSAKRRNGGNLSGSSFLNR
ncbi:hypothetical protein TPY_3104 [Sulfobacillus acidophilus TPY]|nr:hypothetical protein TPY_3104 [Sulfobacillus acidophilus TPY]